MRLGQSLSVRQPPAVPPVELALVLDPVFPVPVEVELAAPELLGADVVPGQALRMAAIQRSRAIRIGS
jgi:hypothetical protein